MLLKVRAVLSGAGGTTLHHAGNIQSNGLYMARSSGRTRTDIDH
jgi:hypothetical protein